ncbi:MAG TPA: hypothetical protein VGK29_15525 [Paludibaculum sp.]|jgi:NADP-dependent 3-hydroxy acid dehydrogenase YdfG
MSHEGRAYCVLAASSAIGSALGDLLENEGATVHRMPRSRNSLELTNFAAVEAAVTGLGGWTGW